MATQLCPICGEAITLTGETKDGRNIGSCGDAFRKPMTTTERVLEALEEMTFLLQHDSDNCNSSFIIKANGIRQAEIRNLMVEVETALSK